MEIGGTARIFLGRQRCALELSLGREPSKLASQAPSRLTRLLPLPPVVAAGDAPWYGWVDGGCGARGAGALCWVASLATLLATVLAASAAMPGSCVTAADADVDAELGRDIGSTGG
jgi:hypothetical protein